MAASAATSSPLPGLSPSYAVICSFLERYGASLDLPELTFPQLERYLRDTSSVPKLLVDLHMKLLRKIGKSVSADRWEKHLVKLCQDINTTWAWELEENGYKDMSMECKTGILKYLCECQFDDNVKFKNAINEEDPDKMRLQPIGRDKDGQMYWFQLDQDNNVRVYLEEQDDLDGSSWKCIVRTRQDLAQVVALLKTQIDPELLAKEKETSGADGGEKNDGGGLKKCEEVTTDEEDPKDPSSVISIKTNSGEIQLQKEDTKCDITEAKSPLNGHCKEESEPADKPDKVVSSSGVIKNEQTVKEEPMEVTESKIEEPIAKSEVVCIKPKCESGDENRQNALEEHQRALKNDQQAKIPLKKRGMKLSQDFDKNSGTHTITQCPPITSFKDPAKVLGSSEEKSIEKDHVNGNAHLMVKKDFQSETGSKEQQPAQGLSVNKIIEDRSQAKPSADQARLEEKNQGCTTEKTSTEAQGPSNQSQLNKEITVATGEKIQNEKCSPKSSGPQTEVLPPQAKDLNVTLSVESSDHKECDNADHSKLINVPVDKTVLHKETDSNHKTASESAVCSSSPCNVNKKVALKEEDTLKMDSKKAAVSDPKTNESHTTEKESCKLTEKSKTLKDPGMPLTTAVKTAVATSETTSVHEKRTVPEQDMEEDAKSKERKLQDGAETPDGISKSKEEELEAVGDLISKPMDVDSKAGGDVSKSKSSAPTEEPKGSQTEIHTTKQTMADNQDIKKPLNTADSKIISKHSDTNLAQSADKHQSVPDQPSKVDKTKSLSTHVSDKASIKESDNVASKESNKGASKESDNVAGKESNKGVSKESDNVAGKESDKGASKESDNVAGKESNKGASKESDNVAGKESNKGASKESEHVAGKESNKGASKESEHVAGKESNKRDSKESGMVTSKECNKALTKDSDKVTSQESQKAASKEREMVAGNAASMESGKVASKVGVKEGELLASRESDMEVSKESDNVAGKESNKGASKESDNVAGKESNKGASKESENATGKGSDKACAKESEKEADKESVKAPSKETEKSASKESEKANIKEKAVVKESDRTASKKTDEACSTKIMKAGPKESEKTVAKESEKTVAKESEKTVAMESEKTVAKEREKTVAKESEKTVAEESEKTVAEESEKTVAEESEKTVAEESEKTVAKESEKTVAEESEKTVAEDSEKTPSKASAQNAVKNSEQAASKVGEKAVAKETDKGASQESDQDLDKVSPEGSSRDKVNKESATPEKPDEDGKPSSEVERPDGSKALDRDPHMSLDEEDSPKRKEDSDSEPLPKVRRGGARTKAKPRRRVKLQIEEKQADSESDTNMGRSLRRSARISRPTQKAVEIQECKVDRQQTDPLLEEPGDKEKREAEEEEEEEEELDEEGKVVGSKPKEKRVDQEGQSKSKGRKRRKIQWSRARRKKKGSEEDDSSRGSGEASSEEYETPAEEDDSDEDYKVERGKRRRRNRERRSSASSTSSDDDLPPNDDPCKHCGLPNHPELILLCDSCDNGYHTACLRPPLMIIPDGEWFCPPCQHKQLCDKLEEQLLNLDTALKKKERAERRKERLVYVGISVENIITPSVEVEEVKEEPIVKEKKEVKRSKSWGRRSTRAKKSISYRFDEFDEAIEEAIEEDIKEAEGGGAGRGKDMANITGHNRGKDMSTILQAGESQENGRPPPVSVGQRRKKRRRLNDLDSDSTVDEEESEDEFRLSDSSEEEDFVVTDQEGESEAEAADSNDSDFASGGGRRSKAGRVRKAPKERRSARRRRRPRGYSDEEEEEETDEDEEEEIATAGSSEYSDSDLDVSMRRSRRSLKRKVNYCETSESEGSKASTNRDKVKPRRPLASSESDASGSSEDDRPERKGKRRGGSPAGRSSRPRQRPTLKRRRTSDDSDGDSDGSGSSEEDRPVRKRVNRIASDDSEEEEKEKEKAEEVAAGGAAAKGPSATAPPTDYSLAANGQGPAKGPEGAASRPLMPHLEPKNMAATGAAPNGLAPQEMAAQDEDEDDLLGVTDLVDYVCNSEDL